MSMVKCQSKNPATCRYHGDNATQISEARKNMLDQMSVNVLNTYQWMLTHKPEQADEYLKAYMSVKTFKNEARVLFYGTPKGEEVLLNKIDETEDLNDKMRLETLHKLVIHRRTILEKNPNVSDMAVPSHEPVFTIPETRVKTDKLGNPEIAVGNKYSELNTFPRIREMVKSDIKAAQKLGFLGDSKVKISQDFKNKILFVDVETSDPKKARSVGRIVDAYNKRTYVTGSRELETKEYTVKMNVTPLVVAETK